MMGPGASRFQPPVVSKPTIGTINSGYGPQGSIQNTDEEVPMMGPGAAQKKPDADPYGFGSLEESKPAGGLGGLTEIGTLDFDVGGKKSNENENNGGYMPSFEVGAGASRRPRRMIPR